MLYTSIGDINNTINDNELKNIFLDSLNNIINSLKNKDTIPFPFSYPINHNNDITFDNINRDLNIMIIPPDFTRFHSKAGILTQWAYEYLNNKRIHDDFEYCWKVVDILPALGTHRPISEEQRIEMFGTIPENLFRIHDWKNDIITIGYVSSDKVKEASDGNLDEPWPVQVNKSYLWEGKHDLILSIGQVVPHEVMGMANYTKNILIGVGGPEAINLSHFIGASYGMERMMGKALNPLRNILNFAADEYLNPKLPIIYILTVIGKDNNNNNNNNNNLITKGLYIGNDINTYLNACDLSIQENFIILDEPLDKVIVYLDPNEFKSTWLGNKSIYRTRMAIKDNGTLIVLAPGIEKFGEDDNIDQLIREYGYRTTNEIMTFLRDNYSLRSTLAAVAHLIHGSSEGRFNIIYCTDPNDGGLTKEEIESVGYDWINYNDIINKYNPLQLNDGFNEIIINENENNINNDININNKKRKRSEIENNNIENIYYISNPALGLWAYKNYI